MRIVMTDDEMAVANELDEYTKSKANWYGDKFMPYHKTIIDSVRGIVCELALRRYLCFSNKYNAGNSVVLCELLDEYWLSVANHESGVESGIVQERLNEAEIQADDWDDSIANDAAAALSIIDACIGTICGSDDCIAALISGIDMLLGLAVKKMIDECAASNGVLAELANWVVSGEMPIPDEQQLIVAIENAKKHKNNPDQFLVWARRAVGR